MERVLLVQPESPVREVIGRTLTRAGYVLAIVQTRVEALEQLDSGSFDLLLVDMELPDGDGESLLEAAQALPAERRPAPVVVSARSDVEHRARCLTAGAEDFLAHPIDVEDLLARVGTVLQIRALKSERRLQTGELTAQRARLFDIVEAAKREWERTVDALPDAIAVVDAGGCLVRGNLAFARLVDVPVGDLRGRGYGELLRTACRPMANGPDGRRYRLRPPTADPRVLEETRAGRPEEDGGGTIRALRDITDRLRYDEAVRQLAEADRLAAIGRLAAGIAHQLNNPLAYATSNVADLGLCVDGVVELVAEKGPEAAAEARQELGEMLGDALEGLRRMRDIVAQMAPFSVIDTEEPRLADVNQEVTRAIGRLQGSENGGFEPDFVPGGTPRVTVYPRHFSDALVHVMRNALQATEGRPGAVHIRTCLEADQVVVEVSDDGPGIPDDQRLQVFEPLFTTREVGQGAGLGLSVARSILRRHGGGLEVGDSAWGGARFRLTVPAREGETVVGNDAA